MDRRGSHETVSCLVDDDVRVLVSGRTGSAAATGLCEQDTSQFCQGEVLSRQKDHVSGATAGGWHRFRGKGQRSLPPSSVPTRYGIRIILPRYRNRQTAWIDAVR